MAPDRRERARQRQRTLIRSLVERLAAASGTEADVRRIQTAETNGRLAEIVPFPFPAPDRIASKSTWPPGASD